MRVRIFLSSLVAVCALLCGSCTTRYPSGQAAGFRFTVVDVGEGLSQIGVIGSDAVVWDMGDTGAAGNWIRAYAQAGAPYIRAIAISHSHVDHMGGLRTLPDSIRFSGEIVASVFEDTALIRETCGSWGARVRFRTIGQGDTMANLSGVTVQCIWPPKNLPIATPISDDYKNTYSLCFIVRYQSNSVLITSDIDTVAERALAARYGFSLMSDIIVVPHHGSSGSVDPVFYGYVSPSFAVISCSADNEYGHPAANVLAMLFQMRVNLYQTSLQGTITASANGYYWTVSGEYAQ
jgi:beta-lactamase superfamily II metal-dependent hydrolase